VGGAARLGGFMFGRSLLGVAPNPPPVTMQEFTRLGAAPELTAGVLFTPARWFSLRIAVDYTYIFVAHTSVHALSETIAVLVLGARAVGLGSGRLGGETLLSPLPIPATTPLPKRNGPRGTLRAKCGIAFA
jgi:hypothetical protein